jgi:D-alanyl-lipoteichoic acid acyltransferase DltB (MBOAT superfamily)
MLFNSFEYFMFLPVVFLVYWRLAAGHLRMQNTWLLAASWFFYGWWSPSFLLLLAASTILDYLSAFGVASTNRRHARFFLWLSLLTNIGLLCAFKYFDYFSLEFAKAMGRLGWHYTPFLLDWVLPVGISFYTFHGMSYVIDVFRSRQQPVRSLVDYGLFVSFFPLLVAGPIERAHHLLPQIQARRVFRYGQAMEGCRLLLWGLFKKVMVADGLAPFVDDIFDNYKQINSLGLVAGMLAFSVQIYADFSGYSDMALGTAKLLGFELLSNFKFPYFSRDIAEFWRRWHVSLSSWFRDYIYIPLGGSRVSRVRAVFNTFVIFLISGFWHGAGWHFIAWGGLHAMAFIPLLIAGRNRNNVQGVVAMERRLPMFKEFTQIILTFAWVSIAWVFFRSTSISGAVEYIKCMLMAGSSGYSKPLYHVPPTVVLSVFFLIVGDWWLRRDERVLRIPFYRQKIIRFALYISLSLLVFKSLLEAKKNDKVQTFIYFDF